MPTVLITVSPEVSAQMSPSRALYPNGFKIGNSLGKPGMRELQKKVLRDALSLLTENVRPGEFVTREYQNTANFTSRHRFAPNRHHEISFLISA